MTEFDSIAAELLSCAPGDFVSARETRAKEAGDAHLAARIRALRKPTTAAWAVNLFAQERAPQLQEALQLAAALREAQAELDAPALAKLGRDRRALTARLAEDAAELARARGGRISAGTLDAVQRTLSAAFFDPGAAAAVASGRLLSELDGDGTPVDPSTVIAGDVADAPVAATRPDDELAALRARRRAEQTLRQAERERAAAERDHAAAERAVRDASRRGAQIAARIAELEGELSAVRESAQAAAMAVSGAEAEERRAAAELARREEIVAAARAASDARPAG
ncbi:MULTISPECIES: transposase [unclassified Microbacterium]|uniref:transposase n=1 Tax=unclassified Microbacterium TaxID=2609290 RepID=UPI003016555D